MTTFRLSFSFLALSAWLHAFDPNVATTVSAFDTIEDMLGRENCPDFRCTKGKAVAPKKRKKPQFVSTGCKGMQSKMMGSSVFGNNQAEQEREFALESCCDQYHACYQICGTSKKHCDDAFEKCGAEMCSSSDSDSAECNKDLNLLKLLSKLQTCPTFTAAQQENCQCIASDEVDERREETLTNFYETYAPDGVSKVPELVKKATSSGKMAALMRKLVQKYSDAIVKVDAPKEKTEWMKPEDMPEGMQGMGFEAMAGMGL